MVKASSKGDSALKIFEVGFLTQKFWRDRPTFVTGGAGLLGSWLVRRLLELGAAVTCLVRNRLPDNTLVGGKFMHRLQIVRGDICNQALLDRALIESEAVTVFHLAAQTIVGIALQNPVSSWENNIRGTWSLLEACRQNPAIKQIIVASSDKAYGDSGGKPYLEEMPLRANRPYELSKACADLLAQSYHATFGLPVCVTRCGNFYGGGDLNWNRIVPGTIRSALRGEPLVIRSNGSSVRDYFYIEDAADAYRLLAESMSERQELCGEAFNFSSETPIAVVDLAQKILSLMGSHLVLEIQATATQELSSQRLNAGKARRDLGWKPQFSLDAGLDKTIRWYRQYLSRPEETAQEQARAATALRAG